jgi:GGDEF domain-containing protein
VETGEAHELHGFELGSELIVRIADLVGPPLLPDGALAARITGDRLAITPPDSDTRAAAKIAEQLQTAAARRAIARHRRRLNQLRRHRARQHVVDRTAAARIATSCPWRSTS